MRHVLRLVLRSGKIVALSSILASSSLPLPAAEEDAKVRFLDGWYVETAERDPKRAIESYRAVLEAGGSARTEARALLRIGLCWRSLGDDEKAKAAFTRVVEGYPSEADLTARAQRYLQGRTEEATAAIALLVESPHVTQGAAARALHERDLEDDLNKLVGAVFEGKRPGVDPELLDLLCEAGRERDLEAYARGVAESCKPRSPPLNDVWRPDGTGASHARLFPRALAHLARAGRLPTVVEIVRAFIDRCGAFPLEEILFAAAEGDPEAPLEFLRIINSRPTWEEARRDIVEALRRGGSPEAIRRALRELTAPPAGDIFAALIQLGEPEPALEEALRGEYWYEEAAALHRATGDWHGYFGPQWSSSEPPPPSGHFEVLLTPLGSRAIPRTTTGQARGPRHHVSLEDRTAAVEAWRKDLQEPRP